MKKETLYSIKISEGKKIYFIINKDNSVLCETYYVDPYNVSKQWQCLYSQKFSLLDFTRKFSKELNDIVEEK